MGLGAVRSVWIGLVVSTLAAVVGCSPSEASPATTPISVDVSSNAPPSTSVSPVSSVAVTSVPVSTAPPERTEADATAEIFAMVDEMYGVWNECLEVPEGCDAEGAMCPYISVGSPAGYSFVLSIEQLQQDGTRTLDADVAMLRAESFSLDDSLNSATMAVCTIHPGVVVKDDEGEEVVVNDDVGRYREVFGLARLANGAWFIASASEEDGVVEGDVPVCDEALVNGESGSILESAAAPDDNALAAAVERASGSSVLADAGQVEAAETEVLGLLGELEAGLDGCFEAPAGCDVAGVMGPYSVGDTRFDDFHLEGVSRFADSGWSYEDRSQVGRVVDDVVVTDDAMMVRVVECVDDQAQLLQAVGDEWVPVDRNGQRLRWTFDWANLADRGWTLVSAKEEGFNGDEELPACFA